MLDRLRPATAPPVRWLARRLLDWGVRPDAVTWAGTTVVVVAALTCFPAGWLWQGALLVGVATCADLVDGAMARESGPTSYGAFLDSTLDRIADGAVLGGLALWLVPDRWWVGVALWALVAGQVTSYARARAASLGIDASRGLVTRADRLTVALLGALLAGLGVAYAVHGALLVLAVLGTVTVVQRLRAVARTARD